MPPNRDSTFNIEFYSKLLDDVLQYSNLSNIILTGDFNARTGTLLDFVFHDDGSIDKNYCQTPDNYIHDQANLRNNIDNISNESGKLLASLCLESGLRILNGRTFGDSLGFFTCFHDNGGVSSVDYILAPEQLFDRIRFFNVQPPNEFSDHCPIWMGLTCNYTQAEESVPVSQLNGKFIWSEFSKSHFIQSINSKKVQVGKDQEKAQSEKDSHSKNQGGKKPN